MGAPVFKASKLDEESATLDVAPAHPWMSRGGVKPGARARLFGASPVDRICLDVGAINRRACRVRPYPSPLLMVCDASFSAAGQRRVLKQAGAHEAAGEAVAALEGVKGFSP